MLFNSEKFNFKYTGYELSQRKFQRNEEAMFKYYAKMKREFAELNKKSSGKTMSASLFGKKALTTTEANRHEKLKKVEDFMKKYGEIKEKLSDVMGYVMKNFSIERYNTPEFSPKFKEVVDEVKALENQVNPSVAGGKKKKRTMKKKSKKTKKSKKVKKVVRRRRTTTSRK